MNKGIPMILGAVLIVSMLFLSCTATEEVVEEVAEEVVEEVAEEVAEEEVVKIKIALSPYQDVATVIIGIEKGIFEKYNLEPEIIPIDWNLGSEMLESKSVHFANMSGANAVAKIDNLPNIRFSNLLYIWEANAVIGQKDSELKTFEDFKDEGMSDEDAAEATIKQLAGLSAIVAREGGPANFLRSICKWAGVDFDEEIDPNIIDMGAEVGLPAFFKGEGDIFLPGIPQMDKLSKEGYPIIIRLKDIPAPGLVMQAGFGTYASFAEENFDVLVRFQAVLFDAIRFVEENPDEGFKIIADYVNSQSAAGLDPEVLRDKYWNKLEYFPLPEESYKLTILEDGTRYWKSRWAELYESYESADVIHDPPPMEEVCIWPLVMNGYLQKYEPDLYEELSGQ